MASQLSGLAPDLAGSRLFVPERKRLCTPAARRASSTLLPENSQSGGANRPVTQEGGKFSESLPLLPPRLLSLDEDDEELPGNEAAATTTLPAVSIMQTDGPLRLTVTKHLRYLG